MAEKVADAEATIAISHFGRSQLMTQVAEEHWDRIHVVRCGIEPARFTPGNAAPADPPNIVCVGRLVHLKGQSLLLRAVALLRERGVDATVTLVGDGPKRGQLEALAGRLGIAQDVAFTGAVGQDEVARRCAAATIFCLPSMAEGLPVVLMEAMALELPVVSTRIMGIPELIEDGATGRLITPGRLDELTDTLEELLQDAEMRQELGRAGRTRVLEEFDVDVEPRACGGSSLRWRPGPRIPSTRRISDLGAGTLPCFAVLAACVEANVPGVFVLPGACPTAVGHAC